MEVLTYQFYHQLFASFNGDAGTYVLWPKIAHTADTDQSHSCRGLLCENYD